MDAVDQLAEADKRMEKSRADVGTVLSCAIQKMLESSTPAAAVPCRGI